MSANSLNSAALPSITGRAAAGPIAPRPSTAVPSVSTATEFPLTVRSQTRSGAVAHLEHAHALDRVGLLRELPGVGLVAAGDRHLPQDLAAELAHQVDVADVAAVLADGGGHRPRVPGVSDSSRGSTST